MSVILCNVRKAGQCMDECIYEQNVKIGSLYCTKCGNNVGDHLTVTHDEDILIKAFECKLYNRDIAALYYKSNIIATIRASKLNNKIVSGIYTYDKDKDTLTIIRGTYE